MEGRRVALWTWLLATALAGLVEPAGAEPRAVLELFTSQGCSACPRADALVGDLSRDPSLVVLSLPIDYWDYLGWKDTLAIPRNSQRQRGYALMRGDREVYTPQMVVNGAVHALGSDHDAIERAVAQTRRDSMTLSVPLRLTTADGKLDVTVPAAKGDEPDAEIWLCMLSRAVPVVIGRGENSGRTIIYHNVVRNWIKLGDWTGTNRVFAIPVAQIESTGADSVAVLLQGGTPERPGLMLGAAAATLR